MPFNFFRRKKEVPKEQPKPRKEIKVAAQKEAKPQVQAGKAQKRTRVADPSVLSRPHITEKASFLAEKGQYVFRVVPEATKHQVKAAVEELYGVEVAGVRIARQRSKTVRVGKKEGIKPGFKKAVVQLQKGQTIEVISR
tara:strand:+ start:6199 stop:6615 length:417 start_codon:yes stop_codon:yes gene_type:complete